MRHDALQYNAMRWGGTGSPIQVRGVQMDGCRQSTIKSLAGVRAFLFAPSWQLTLTREGGVEDETREISVNFHVLMRRY